MFNPQPLRWQSLLNRAARLYDDPGSNLGKAARSAGWGGFSSGANWMRLALEAIRGVPVALRSISPIRFQAFGLLKYGTASGASVLVIVASFATGWPAAALFAVPVFYVVEAQSVFLFPLILDGHSRPIRTARLWTIRDGGTLRVMAVVMPIAATMLFGGFFGRGFIRSWCLGCLAICVWYEDLR